MSHNIFCHCLCYLLPVRLRFAVKAVEEDCPDITNDITANTKLFVDDAKVKSLIEKEEDVEALQENLDKLYKWEEENKMKFNGKKFQLLRYGTNDDLKNNTVYFTGHMEEIIEQAGIEAEIAIFKQCLSLIEWLFTPPGM